MHHFLLIAACLSITGSATHDSAVDCPCSNSSLCRSLNPANAKALKQNWEVFVFARTSNWTAYDWSIVTTVAYLSDLAASAADVCLAHSHGARVVLTYGGVPQDLTNSTQRSNMIDAVLQKVVAAGMDGINLDIEQLGRPKDQLTTYVQEMAAALRQKIPSAQFSFDLAVAPYGQKEHYDHHALAKVLDFIVPMAYDENWGATTPEANSPLAALTTSLDQYHTLGVEPEQLVFAMPWYGTVWPCDNSTLGSPCNASLGSRPWQDVVSQPKVSEIVCHLGVDNTSSAILDSVTATKQFEFLATEPWCTSQHGNVRAPNKGSRHVATYDDGDTMTLKIDALRKSASALSLRNGNTKGLRGAGMFYAECLDSDRGGMDADGRARMWAAFKPPASVLIV